MIGMVGLQWYEGDEKKPLVTKIKTLLAHYQHKYGKRAQICLVSDKNAAGIDFTELSNQCGVTVRSTRMLPMMHLWAGEEAAT